MPSLGILQLAGQGGKGNSSPRYTSVTGLSSNPSTFFETYIHETLIVAQGQPPAWTPPTTTEKLKEDHGEYFRDPNAARYPTHPMEPAVRAILAECPEFPTTSVDIFACSSTIGNLLRFVSGEEKQFRILVEAIGDSVFFERRENSPTELIPNVRGFGHTFPEAYTSWDAEVKGSISHQRIIK